MGCRYESFTRENRRFYRCAEHRTEFPHGKPCPEAGAPAVGESPACPASVLQTPTNSDGGGADFDTRGEVREVYETLKRDIPGIVIKRCEAQLKALRLYADLAKDAALPARVAQLEQALRTMEERLERNAVGGNVEPPPAQDSTEAVH